MGPPATFSHGFHFPLLAFLYDGAMNSKFCFSNTRPLLQAITGLIICLGVSSCSTPDPISWQGMRSDAVLIGYWHNWKGSATEYIRLRDVPSMYNQVHVAFAVPEHENSGVMVFAPSKQTPESLKADIRKLQRRGTRVLLSVGGGRHPVVLNTPAKAREFAESVSALIHRYGFNGLDLNLEKHSLVLDPGDVNFERPTTPRVRYLIQAVRDVVSRFGPGFILTAAPETQFIVGGYKRYGGWFGGYLPVLHGLRDHLDLVHMQYYNSGTQLVYTGRPTPEEFIVTKAEPDFIVALTEMLILGFPVAQNPDHYFPGFGAGRVAIGLPATPSAARGGGYLKPNVLTQALIYLVDGERAYSTDYRLRQRKGHPNLAGLMTWSVNWDASRDGGTPRYGFARAATHRLRPPSRKK